MQTHNVPFSKKHSSGKMKPINTTMREIERVTDDFEFIKTLSNQTFPVLSVFSQKLNKKLALKIFPHDQETSMLAFKRESRVGSLSHPHIIRIITQKEYKSELPIFSDFSYILMEYAPYGSFCNLIEEDRLPQNEKLARTFFHQLIDGLEYLHKHGIAHLDLKLDNLLLGEDSKLKIIDFESSQWQNQKNLIRKGTKHYRAPEIKNENCVDGFAADVYSAAIILFLLRAHTFPYNEDTLDDGYDLFELLMNNPEEYWQTICQIQPELSEVGQDFKELFLGMTSESGKRLTIPEIKETQWYKGEIYKDEELSFIMNHIVKCPSPARSSSFRRANGNLEAGCTMF